MLARPWPTNSWLLSNRWPLWAATVRAMDTASTSPMAVTATAPGVSFQIRSKSRIGRSAKGGSDRGIAPSTCTPCSSRRKMAVTAAVMTMATRAAGREGFILRHRMITRIAPTPRPRLIRWVWSPWSIRSLTVSPSLGLLGMSSRRRWRSWLKLIRMPAPAVKPRTTLSATKFTSTPQRSRPMDILRTPTMIDM